MQEIIATRKPFSNVFFLFEAYVIKPHDHLCKETAVFQKNFDKFMLDIDSRQMKLWDAIQLNNINI